MRSTHTAVRPGVTRVRDQSERKTGATWSVTEWDVHGHRGRVIETHDRRVLDFDELRIELDDLPPISRFGRVALSVQRRDNSLELIRACTSGSFQPNSLR